MDEAAARAQDTHRLVRGVSQAVAAMQYSVADDEVVLVAQQRQVLEREIRILKDQQLGLGQSQQARQPDRTRHNDSRLVLRILGCEAPLQPASERRPHQWELWPQLEHKALPQAGPESFHLHRKHYPQPTCGPARPVSGSYRTSRRLASRPWRRRKLNRDRQR